MASEQASAEGADFEQCLDFVEREFASGLSDGLPVVPVAESRLQAAIAASGRAGDEIVGTASTSGSAVTVADLAETALLAGCLPEYLPVVVAAFDVLLDERFPLELLVGSAGSYFPLVLVNGPERRRIDINCASNLFGPGFRANATIGRAVRLGLIRHADATPRGRDRSSLGSAYKYACVIGEDEEASPWAPLHTELGFASEDSTVMVMAARKVSNFTNQRTDSPAELLPGLAEEVSTVSHFNQLDVELGVGGGSPKALLVLAGDHRQFIAEQGWTRRQVQEALHAAARRSAGTVRAAGYRADPRLRSEVADDDDVFLYRGPEDFLVISGGGVSGREAIASAVYADIRALPAERAESPRVSTARAPADAAPSVEDYVALVDAYVEEGHSDGWPVIPPDAESVERMVAASGRASDDVLGHHSWRSGPITTVDAAVNACMAGCLPEYMPVVVAAFELLFAPRDPSRARDAVAAIGAAPSAGSFFPWLVVNGPIVDEIGLNSRGNLFGPGYRANATIGRAIRLGLRNLAALKPDLLDRSSVGHAFKYSCVIAEDEASSPWDEPFHVALGFARDQSVATILWGDCPRLTLHDEARTPDELLRAIGEEISTITRMDSTSAPGTEEADSLESYNAADRYERVVVLGGDHSALLRSAGWTRQRTREFLASRIGRTVGHARARGYRTSAAIRSDQPDDEWVPMVTTPENVHLISAGGAGGASVGDIVMYKNSRVIEVERRKP